MQVIYRISENSYPKEKPDYINNENCLLNALRTFNKDRWWVIADDVSEDTKSFINSHIKTVEYVSAGNGAKTFNLALDFALNEIGADFVSCYDHPDKYLNPIEGGNPFCFGRAEDSKVYLGEYCHWKLTNSTTMTFAAKVKTLKQDEYILRKWTDEDHPHDFQMFMELRQRGRRIASSLPGYSTHGETKWLSPLTEWRQEL